MLVHFGVTPYLVFDGDRLPSKAGTEKSRRDRRKESRAAGMELLKMGKTSQAHQELQKAVDITPEMARMLIEELKKNNIQYVVAPYEADSQLAYLEKKGMIDAILSEDSDLLVFGAKTLLTKLDQYGDCVMVKQEDFTACRDVNLVGWTCDDFRRMAILSGCDYLEGIHKMGLKTAHRLLRKYKTVDRLLRGAQLEGKFKIPAGYMDAFEQAEKTFKYQWVYCPKLQRMVNLTEPASEEEIAGLTYIGTYVESEMARKLAAGELNPMTKQPIVITKAPAPSYQKKTPLLARSKTVDYGKDSKKISSFFRPSRTPLAELDPNSFTPSPSQQQVLAANANREWRAENVDHRPSSVPSRAQQPRPALLERTNSAPNPFKRQKLCADEESAETASPAIATQRSRFFGNSAYQPSPLGAKGTRKSNGRAQDFNLWSDDSITDAMEALPDISTPNDSSAETAPSASAIARIRRFSVFSEAGQSKTTGTETTAAVRDDQTQKLDEVDEHEAPQTDPFGAALRQDIGSLRDRFSFTMSSVSLPTPPLTATQSSRDGASFLGEPATPPQTQSLSSEDFDAADVQVGQTPCQPAAEVEAIEKSVPPLESPVATRLPPLVFGTTELVLDALSRQASPVKGSEDLMLIPDSEADVEIEEDEEVPGLAPRRLFDVGRFAFSG